MNNQDARLALDMLQASEERKKRAEMSNAVKEIMDNFNAISYVKEIESCHQRLEKSAKTQKKTVRIYMTTRSGREILVSQFNAGVGNAIMVKGIDDELVESYVFTNINTIELVFKVEAESNDIRSEAVVFN